MFSTDFKRMTWRMLSEICPWFGSGALSVILRFLVSEYLWTPELYLCSSGFVPLIVLIFLLTMRSCHLMVSETYPVFQCPLQGPSQSLPRSSLCFLWAPVVRMVCASSLILTKSFVLLVLGACHICSLTVNIWAPLLYIVDCIF